MPRGCKNVQVFFMLADTAPRRAGDTRGYTTVAKTLFFAFLFSLRTCLLENNGCHAHSPYDWPGRHWWIELGRGGTQGVPQLHFQIFASVGALGAFLFALVTRRYFVWDFFTKLQRNNHQFFCVHKKCKICVILRVVSRILISRRRTFSCHQSTSTISLPSRMQRCNL